MKGNFVLSLGLLLILVYIAFAEPSSDEGQALEPAAVGTVDDEIMMELNKAWGVYSWYGIKTLDKTLPPTCHK